MKVFKIFGGRGLVNKHFSIFPFGVKVVIVKYPQNLKVQIRAVNIDLSLWNVIALETQPNYIHTIYRRINKNEISNIVRSVHFF